MYQNWFIVKYRAVLRKLMCRYLSNALPIFIVTEYPKSGGTWVSQILAHVLELPFYRNQFPKLTPQVMHGHYRFTPNMRNVFCVIRDGRDVMVSYYYHSLFLREDRLNYHEYVATSQALNFHDPDNIQENLPRFIEYKFTVKKDPRFSWPEFIIDWVDKAVPFIKYEEMLTHPEKEIKSALDYYSIKSEYPDRIEQAINKYSFRNLSGRERGGEEKKSFLRKGIAGDWKSKFSLESRQIFQYYAGAELIRLGYETNNKWLTN